jgi:hypothetical protein
MHPWLSTRWGARDAAAAQQVSEGGLDNGVAQSCTGGGDEHACRRRGRAQLIANGAVFLQGRHRGLVQRDQPGLAVMRNSA